MQAAGVRLAEAAAPKFVWGGELLLTELYGTCSAEGATSRAGGATILGGSGGMLPRENLKS